MNKADRDYAVEVAKNVKRLRERKRMTRAELSEKVGASPSYVYHVEDKKKMPSLLMGLRMAKVLGVAPEVLLS